MRYALQNFEIFIQTELSPETILLSETSPKLLLIYMTRMTEHKRLIKSFLTDESFGFKKAKEIQLLIHRFQLAIINLSDQLVGYIATVEKLSDPDTAPAVLSVYQHGLQALEDLIDFIKHDFARFFNWDEKVSANQTMQMQYKLKDSLIKIMPGYRLAGIDEDLLELMTYPIFDFIGTKNNKQITCREMHYLETLCKEYGTSLAADKKKISHHDIFKLQIYLNYNNFHFFEYYVNIIENELAAKISNIDKIATLSWWLKTVNQINQHPTIMHKPDACNAKDQLIFWLKDEMNFFETQEALGLKSTPPADLMEKALIILIISLSVKELGLFIKVLIDTKTLQADSKTEVINAVAKIFQTTNKEEITAGSLRKNFYTNDEHTKNKLKDRLKNMINQINEY